MSIKRIIPRLDIKGPNLVKGVQLEGLRVLGTPSSFAKYYYENGADELLLVDIVASLYERNSLHDTISRTARDVAIPITVGGGIRSIVDIKEVLRAGADKVSLNTAAIKQPEFIRQAALEFGSSTVVVSLEAIKQEDGNYYCFTDNGREYTGIEVVSWIQEVQDLGAGEIILTSVDRDGTCKGFECDLIDKVLPLVSVPLIVHGGCGKKKDVLDVFERGNVDAVSVASMFHYEFIKKIDISKVETTEGNLAFLKSRKTFGRVEESTVGELKKFLKAEGVQVRI